MLLVAHKTVAAPFVKLDIQDGSKACVRWAQMDGKGGVGEGLVGGNG